MWVPCSALDGLASMHLQVGRDARTKAHGLFSRPYLFEVRLVRRACVVFGKGISPVKTLKDAMIRSHSCRKSSIGSSTESNLFEAVPFPEMETFSVETVMVELKETTVAISSTPSSRAKTEAGSRRACSST
jgi:hypothetical protein